MSNLKLTLAVFVFAVAGEVSGFAGNCAWVLWKKVEPRLQQDAASWTIETAMPEFPQCQAAQRERVEAYLKPGPLDDKPRTKVSENSVLVPPTKERADY